MTTTQAVYIVTFNSPSGGHKGHSTYITRELAEAEQQRLRAKGYRTCITVEKREEWV